MTQHTTDTPTGESSDGSSLDRPERNRYFHGKLMTARDMQAEQQYHRGQFRAHARHTTGDGVVCGLDVDVVGNIVDGLSITVEQGYALDCYGRPVVVPNTETKELGPNEVPDGERISVFLDYSECVKESVPIPGSEKSSEEECAYNRVLEVFEVRCEGGDPEDGTVKSVPDVEFPTRTEVMDDDGESVEGPTNAELATIAESFTVDENGDAATCTTGDPTVFLGVFERIGDSSWEWVHDVPRSRVYTNDMLYAATARHTADFRNPHQVSLATKQRGDGAAIHVEDDERNDANVTVTSSDDTVAVSADAGANQVDLTAGEALIELIEDRLAPMAQYVMDKTLTYKLRTFSAVANIFGNETASEIAEQTRSAIDDRIYTDREAYLSFIEDIAGLERSVSDELGDRATEESLERYGKTIERLDEVLGAADETDVLQVALAQDEVCEAAERLEAAYEDLRESLQQKRDAYATVAERFDSDVAGEVVTMTDEAIENGMGTSGKTYIKFITEVFPAERELLGELENRATPESLERYNEAINRLGAALEKGAGMQVTMAALEEGGNPQSVMAAQNAVSETAEQLTRGEETPEETLQSSLLDTKSAFSGVIERFDSSVARNVVKMVTSGLENGVATSEENFVRFVRELHRAEGDLRSELEGAASQSSLERYDEAMNRLGAALEEKVSAREVAIAQYRVSQAAGAIQTSGEDISEDLQASLQIKRDAFSKVVETFDSTIAGNIVTETERALKADVSSSPDEYATFVRRVAQLERELVGELRENATQATLGSYAVAVDELSAAITNEARTQELATAQNGVSRAAGALESARDSRKDFDGFQLDTSKVPFDTSKVSFDTSRLPFDPSEYTVSDLQKRVDTVSDPKKLEEMMASEMTKDDRKTALEAIRKRMDEVEE